AGIPRWEMAWWASASARETPRARMQGWLASPSALTLALATFASGWLTGHFGERAYLAKAALAMAGLVLALAAAAMKRRTGETANLEGGVGWGYSPKARGGGGGSEASYGSPSRGAAGRQRGPA